jgi:hypothetical protein
MGFQLDREFVVLYNQLAQKGEEMYETNRENEIGAVLELLFKDLKVIVFDKKKKAHDDIIKDISSMMMEIKNQIILDMTKDMNSKIKQFCTRCISSDESEPSVDISNQLFSSIRSQDKQIDWSKFTPKK